MQQLLSIVDLHVKFQGRNAGEIHALNGVHLRVTTGTALGILGESGCGKSTLARVLLRLLPKTARIGKGSIQFEGRDLLALSERELERIRGARISLIPQEAGLALNPLMKVGKQVAEVVRAHNDWSWRRCQEEAETLLRLVHLEDSARRIFDAYPHQLSGGQQQRVVIAQAISCHPALVVADEPTASLDVEAEEGKARARSALDYPRSQDPGGDSGPDCRDVRGQNRRGRIGQRHFDKSASSLRETADLLYSS
jgi:ABC-type glutathione transport system ATPase component